MNGYTTMALPQHPLPTPFPAGCAGSRVVFGNAMVPECGDRSQAPAYLSPKRMKQEPEHAHSYPSSPRAAVTANEYQQDAGSYENCVSPRAFRKSPVSREMGHRLSDTKPDMTRISNHKNNNSINNNNNNAIIYNNNNNNNNGGELPMKISEGLSEVVCTKAQGRMQLLDKMSVADYEIPREGSCKSSPISEHINVKEETANIRVSDSFTSSHDDASVSMTTLNHHRVPPRSPTLGQSFSSSSPSSPSFSQYSSMAIMPSKSLSSSSSIFSSSSVPTIPTSSAVPASLSSPSSSSSDTKEQHQEEEDEIWRVSIHSDEKDNGDFDNNEDEDGRNSKLSCIVDIETDTPPASPDTPPSPSHSPLNLSKSCLESTTPHNDKLPSHVLDSQRDTNDELCQRGCSSSSPERPEKPNGENLQEGQFEDEETRKRRKTNFSIDAILSSKFGAGNSSPEPDCHEEAEVDEAETHPSRCTSGDQASQHTVIHSENSAFSAVDLSFKALNSSSSLSPAASSESSNPSSPRSYSSSAARSPTDSHRTNSSAEDESFDKAANAEHNTGHPHNPYNHLFKMGNSPRDPTRPIEDVYGDVKNNVNSRNANPFQRFFPAMIPSHFPVPKHGSSAPAVAEMEEFFHRNFPLINQAYSHLVGKFPFAYLPSDQSFPLHNISKMHPDQNHLFDPTRILATPQTNPINSDRTPGLPGNNNRFFPNFPNAKEFTENINPKSNQSLMNNLYNAHNNNINNVNNVINKNNSANNTNSASLKNTSLHHARSQLTPNGLRTTGPMQLPPVPHLQMDSKPPVSHPKPKESVLRKPFSKTPPTLIPKGEKVHVSKEDSLEKVSNLKPDPTNSSDGEESSDAKPNSGADRLWPAWVFCTRYSDRPSSGPRSRKPKRKASVDEKRPRTAFTNDQLQRLKREFEDCRYLTETRRRNLASELGLSESQIKIWFQNKRAKIKKSMGVKNTLALKLMEEGLYNHTTVKGGEDDN